MFDSLFVLAPLLPFKEFGRASALLLPILAVMLGVILILFDLWGDSSPSLLAVTLGVTLIVSTRPVTLSLPPPLSETTLGVKLGVFAGLVALSPLLPATTLRVTLTVVVGTAMLTISLGRMSGETLLAVLLDFVRMSEVLTLLDVCAS